MRKILTFLLLSVIYTVCTIDAQAQLDQWIRVNEGFAKCANIGESAGEAEWYRDNFNVRELIDRRGEMYAVVEYNNTPTTFSDGTTPHPEYNHLNCSGGFFRHDTIRWEWVKVADRPPVGQYGTGKYVTNHSEIYHLSGNGRVYQFTTDYANYPTGWKKISTAPHDPVNYGAIYSGFTGCSPNTNLSVVYPFATGNVSAAFDDTVYVFFSAKNDIATCPGYNNVVGKFSVTAGKWIFENVGAMPHQAYGNPGLNSNHWTITFADRVGGIFRYFWNSANWGRDNYIPSAFFVYDPRESNPAIRWKNVSRGPNFENLTGSSCVTPACVACRSAPVYDPVACGPIEQGGPNVGGNYTTSSNEKWFVSWNGRKILVNTWQGIYEWNGNEWIWRADKTTSGPIALFTENGVFSHGFNRRGRLTQNKFDGKYQIIGGWDVYPTGWNCVHVGPKELNTPNDGQRLYVVSDGLKDINDCGWSSEGAQVGVYTIKPDPLKPSPVTNLHLQSATYLGAGGAGGNDAVGVGVVSAANKSNSRLFVAGNFPSVTAVSDANLILNTTPFTPLGGSGNRRGRLIELNVLGDTIHSSITLGDVLYDFEIQNNGKKRMVVSGDFGVAVLDSTGKNVIWHKDRATVIADLGLTGTSFTINYPIVDIADNGNVVMAMGNNFLHRYRVVAPNGATYLSKDASLFGQPGRTQEYLTDVAIDNNRVFIAGFNNGCLDYTNFSCPFNGQGNITSCAGVEIQSAWIRHFTIPGLDNVAPSWIASTYDYLGEWGNKDIADTRVYRINVGADGKLYMLGESAGTESVYRWNGGPDQTVLRNGCSNPASVLVRFDPTNDGSNTKSAHVAFYATVDPSTGLVERGQWLLPRQNNGTSNSFRVSNGYIHADEAGYVYVGGSSSFKYAGRDVSTVNGMLVGTYGGGDMSVLIVTPDYQSRTYWGSFSDTLGSGSVCGIGVEGSVIAAVGDASKGLNFTGASRYEVFPPVDEKCDKEFKRSYAINPNPFNADWNDSNNDNDAYLAVWYQDVWNYATCDSLEVPVRDTDFDTVCVTCHPDFTADLRTICVGDMVTFANISEGDSTGHFWNFGAGASIGTPYFSAGPVAVSYSTPGLKTVQMDVIMKGNFTDHEKKLDYINVLDNSTSLVSVTGPDTVCSGAAIYFDTEPVFGVTYYEWTVPVDAQILEGQGGPTIKMVFGSSSGQVSVRGVYPCGITPLVSKQVNVQFPTPNGVLLVHGGATLSPADTETKNRLTLMGYNVLTLPDTAVEQSKAECMGLVVVSNTTDTTVLNYKLREINAPVVVMNPYMYGYMNFTNGATFDRGIQPAQQTVKLVNTDHEIGMVGVPVNSSVAVYTAPGSTVGWGVPSASATVIAEVLGDPTKAAVFTYEQGALMKGYTAPNRRVGYFMNAQGWSIEGANADTLFDRVVCWAMRNCPTDRKILVKGAEIKQYCKGDSIIVDYVKTGSFIGTKPLAGITNEITIDNTETANNSDGTKKIVYSGGVTRTDPVGTFVGTNFFDNSLSETHYTFRPEIIYAGEYEVMFNMPGRPASYVAGLDSLSVSAEVTVTHAGGSVTFYINQRALAPGSYHNLGTYTFNAGTAGSVRIDAVGNTTRKQRVLVDAIKFTPVDLNPVGNTFSLQLSNSVGNFNSAVTIATIQDTASGTFRTVIPENTPSGTGYRLRVLSSNPGIVSNDTGVQNSDVLTVIGLPQEPGLITGVVNACQGGGPFTYTVNPAPGVTDYLWTRPVGTEFPDSPGNLTYLTTNQVDVAFDNSTGGTLRVQSVNQCGVSDPITGASLLTINITGFPPATPAAIGGPDTVCVGDTFTYSVAAIPNATAYHWDLNPNQGNIEIISGQGTNVVNVKFSGASPSNAVLNVVSEGNCGSSGIARTKTIRIDNAAAIPKVTSIAVSPGFCAGEYVYTALPVVPGVSYQWTVPSYGTLIASSANTVTVRYTAAGTGESVTVTPSSDCPGVGIPFSLPVTINPGSFFNLFISLGPDTIGACGIINLTPGAYVGYLWSTGATTPSIDVSAAGVYWVDAFDATGCSDRDSVVIVSQNPVKPTATDQTVTAGAACGSSDIFVTATGGSGNYRWYANATGGSAIDSVAELLMTSVTGDTNIYVSSWQFGNAGPTTHAVTTGSRSISFMDTPNAPNMPSLTYEVWMLTTNTGLKYLFSTAGGHVRAHLNMAGAPAGTMSWILQTDAGTLTMNGVEVVNDGQWHHVAMTYDNGVCSTFVDGVFEATSTLGTYVTAPTGRWHVGGDNNVNVWIGSIDEVHIWNKARTLAEINADRFYCLSGTEDGLYRYFNYNNSWEDMTGNSSVTAGTYPRPGASFGTSGPSLNCTVCESNRDTLTVTFQGASNQLQLNDYAVCTPGPLVMTALGGSGNYYWYKDAAKTQKLDSTASYTAASVTGDTNFYVTSWEMGSTAASTAFTGDVRIDGCRTSGLRTAYTVEAWIKTDATDKRILLGDQNLGLRAHLNNFGAVNGRMGWKFNTTSPARTDSLVGTIKINDYKWHHVAFVFDNGVASSYVDGVLDATLTVSSQIDFSAGGRYRIANESTDGASNWNGFIDEFRIWETARTPLELIGYRNKCLIGNELGLKSYYQFENNQNNIASNGCTVAGGSSAYHTSAGPLMACQICESAVDTLRVSFSADKLTTGILSQSAYCSRDSISVPFTICNANDPCTAGTIADRFGVNVLNPAWTKLDKNVAASSYSIANGVLTLNAQGTNTTSNPYTTGDSYSVLYRTDITGNFDVEVTIVSHSNPGQNGTAAGLMIANDFTNNANEGGYVAVGISNGTFRMARDTDNNGTLNGVYSGGTVTYPARVRLVKSGTSITGYYHNGTTWVALGVAITATGANANQMVGIFASGASSSYQSIVFDNFITNKSGGYDTSSYTFKVQLSNASGSFASGTTLLADSLKVSGVSICDALQGQVNTILPVLPAGGTYRVRVLQYNPAGALQVTGTQSANTFTVNGNIWTGATSTDWHEASNWTCQVPDSTADATIPNATNDPVISAGMASVKDLQLAAGASLTLNTGQELGLWGNMTVNATATFVAGTSTTLSLNGSAAPQLLTGVQTVDNLTLNNPLGASSSANLNMTGSFNFVRGKFSLESGKTLDMCAGTGSITGMDANRYFINDNVANPGTPGFLKVSVPGDGSSIIFPVGLTGSYNPAVISNLGSGTCFQVRVFGSVLEEGLTGAAITNSVVNRTWEITPSQPVGPEVDITLQWNASEEMGSFDRNNSFVAKNRGISGDNVYLEAGPQGIAAGSNPYTATAVAVTTFSKFIITSDEQFLPIDLLSFKGKNVDGHALLEWSTGYEASCAAYYLEKSTDAGESFQTIGEVACKNKAEGADYTYWDRLLTQDSWYRLRQVDVDGQTTFSNIIFVRQSALQASAFSLSPNPSSTFVKLSYGVKLTEWDEVSMKVTTMQGVEVARISGSLNTLNKELNRLMKQLAGGMYIISLDLNDSQQHIKWTVLK